MIGNRLKFLRKELGLSQKEFANELLLNKSSISLFEQNKRNVSKRTLNYICASFGIRKEWLELGSGSMYIEETTESKFREIKKLLSKQDTARLKAINSLINLTPTQTNIINSICNEFIRVKEEQYKL